MDWIELFNGRNTDGWHIYNNISDGSAWKVTDGILHLDAMEKENGMIIGGGDLVTNKQYASFHLKLEWKLDTGGNSGILFHVQEEPSLERSWHSGPEMQVLDNAVHRDASIDTHRAGDLYDLIAASPETVNAAGEWNLAEIIVQHASLRFRLNGIDTLTTELWNESWKERISASKFRDFPGFGMHRKGHIVLQDHGDPVWYRNIVLREL